MEQFKDYAYYYNAFYKDKDYCKEAKDVDSLLKKVNTNINDIIIYGCGTGGHDVELSKLGYKCHGIDLSPEMIEMAKKTASNCGLSNTYEVADIREYNPSRKFDAVLSLFHVMSYQTENADIVRALKSARSALNEGGIILFDVWYGPGVLRDLPSVRIKEVEDDQNHLVRLCRPSIYENEDKVDVNYEILVINKQVGSVRTIKETHHMRYYFRPEMEYYLKNAGFELIGFFDCNTLGNTDFSSWTSYFIAKAV